MWTIKRRPKTKTSLKNTELCVNIFRLRSGSNPFAASIIGGERGTPGVPVFPVLRKAKMFFKKNEKGKKVFKKIEKGKKVVKKIKKGKTVLKKIEKGKKIFKCTVHLSEENIARVQNSPGVTILSSLFGLCIFILTSLSKGSQKSIFVSKF